MIYVRVWFLISSVLGIWACTGSDDRSSTDRPVVPTHQDGSDDRGAAGAAPIKPVEMDSAAGGSDAAPPDERPSNGPRGIGDGEEPGGGRSQDAGWASAGGAAPPPAMPSGAPSSSAGGTPPASGSAADTPRSSSGERRSSTPGSNGQAQAGTLTAGAWDDNRNIDRFNAYRAKHGKLPGALDTSDDEHRTAHVELSAARGPRQTLDVALVIDTTGSMGDEISYLQAEFLALSSAIEAKFPEAEQRWSLVVYRDQGDEYVTRWFDFRDDAVEFREKLAQQSANGGGDTPEAPDSALSVMNKLAWRTDGTTARLAFWVADAPHHEQNARAMRDAVRRARELGIHVYPVASSGVDELMELTMRSAAQLTGGRYLFLTDDSGVGGEHKEPSIPCYFVTRLDNAILRMVDIEMSGTYREPESADVIRTGGDPKDGSCTLGSGEVLEVF